ncbi:hypothetical protein [Lactiplantibacillus pentosus]|uniref:hypothetical protein n=1 Tax=Lactiplantibacillus pentosus TaxID=1589 RepID=UPI0010D6503C|nr:hypothetical protein [Lactiplantibacillus pentosus]TDG92824.1 hypothetical protein C5L29_000164 [Lactiplantibacillus pentosus]UZO87409.1 hypothetical protein HPK28_10435 [Lactiplantibacillus pentosus]WKF74803.1 hypothetical protein QYC20_10460 [Lactiplantibacillus pentosus]WKG36684.1 hypothetical protein QYC21_10445 [Lactiplantibacillus pentosus]GEO50190.1 hypothetical protein LPE01_15510 [Lactiplantibacillus pentosus]
MKKHRGTILLSVISLLMIGGAFETQRYMNFRARQHLHYLILESYDHPYQAKQHR